MAKLNGVRRRCTSDCTRNCRKHKFQFTVEIPGPNGKRRQFSGSGYDTAEMAAAARAEIIRAHKVGTLPSSDGKRHETVNEFLSHWLEAKISSGNLRASTALSYAGHIERYLAPQLGCLRVKDLRREHIEGMFSAIRRVKTISPATRASHPRHSAVGDTRRGQGWGTGP